jgi:glycosyltransferase involved in cell wall biosynthesis
MSRRDEHTMRIAQVAPLCERVPPKLYGGTERVVAFLTDELVNQGHDVTLFASGDSETLATLAPMCPRAQRLDGGRMDTLAEHILMIERVLQRAGEFDLVHFHIAQMHFPIARRLPTPHVTTLHGRLDMPELVPLYREFADIPIVSISDAQRSPLPDAGWIGTVYHGLPPCLLRFQPSPGSYLAFLGRISPEKRVDRAIAIAKASGCPLRIAAKVDAADRDYFERDIRALLDHPLIDFVGEIGESAKSEFLGGARALLFPIDWPEPFGLVQIESLACGTPVIAFRGGSVPEIVDAGATGFIVESIDEAVRAVAAIDRIDRRACRQVFERRFSVARMARDYVRLYKRVADKAAANMVA